jgi:hypothetical protein
VFHQLLHPLLKALLVIVAFERAGGVFEFVELALFWVIGHFGTSF